MTGVAALDIRDLRVGFDTPEGRVLAVNGVSLQVAAGETLAVVGESGCGKSATMLAVMGLLDRHSAHVEGEALLDGADLLRMSDGQRRAVRGRDIGMVFQDPMSSLNPVMTVGDQVDEVLRLHLGMPRAEARSRTVELLERVGIPGAAARADAHPHQFSGGMRQRVMIAMALACRPRVLIADEPTTALDVTIQAQIVSLVRDLQAELGMAVIWISHDLGVVASLADRVAVMYAGRIVEEATVGDLFAGARHHYSVGLLRSVPRLDVPATDRLTEIPGAPPASDRAPAGCAFAPRCGHVDARCLEQRPLLEPVAEGHRAACHHLALGATPADLIRPGPTHPVPGPRPPAVVAAVPGPPSSPAQGIASPLLQVDDLKVHFPVRRGWRRSPASIVRAVDGVTLQLGRGETLGLVGESGSGKTTLGRSVMRLVDATAGRIRFDGEDLTHVRGRDLRRLRPRFQMVFQDPGASMNPGMRVRDVIAEPLEVAGGRSRQDIEARVGGLIDRVGLQRTTIDRYPHQFSGGQRQRIAVARALALAPELLVCDEPVSSLDVSVQAQIINLLRDLQDELGLSLLFIAHDLAVVRHISDRVAVMYLGRIVELADRGRLYAVPLHPYTRALLRSAPVPDPALARRDQAAPVAGDLPDPARPPAGCRFHPRCPIARPGLCDVQEPALRELAPGQLVACHLAEAPVAAHAAREAHMASANRPGALGAPH